MRVAEHLLVVVLIVGNGDVGWVALCVGFELKTRVYEAAEWCDAEGCIATTDLGMKLGVDFSLTWSCYRGGERPCGTCDSCLLRAKAFEEAGFEDPALKL